MELSKKKIINNIDIVLVDPQFPENIGLVSRVMKNTSFSNLALVSHNLGKKSYDVAKRSSNILDQAKAYGSIEEAVKDSHFVFGTSRRTREDKFTHNFNQIKYLIASIAQSKKISILFGRENFGLSKKELELCDSIFYLPADKDFSSYNLAQAAGIVCYGVFNLIDSIGQLPKLELAKRKDYETFYYFLEENIRSNVKKERLDSTLLTLRRIFQRTYLTKNEISLLKSLLIKR